MLTYEEFPEKTRILWDRYSAYCQEVRAIEKRLGNSISLGKREKLQFRHWDLENRLIPAAVSKLEGIGFS